MTPLRLRLSTPTGGEEIILTAPATVGRSHLCAIPLLGPRASRMHALLNPTDSGWTVEDLQSKAGSLVNGQTIQGVTPISPGDTLFFAGNTLLVLPQ